MVKISVILPIYNVEDYLDETLSCLLNQTMVDDIEVLMIDDGSTDNSRYIIERYALDHENFHAFHKQNEGQGIARNFALKMAKGEYVHFFDSDDYILPNAYETLYNFAIKNGSDIVIGDVLRFGDYNMWSDSLFKHSFEGISEDIESTTLNQMHSLLWDSSTSNKLYKREFLEKNDIRFPDKKIFFEDLIFSLESYIKADSIYITKYVFYYWRFRGKKTSVTQQHDNVRNFFDRLEILNLQHDLMKKNNLDKGIVHYEYKKWLNHDLKIFLKKLINYPSEYHQDLINEVKRILDFIPNGFIDELNSYKRVLYQMVKNNDIEQLVAFAPLEDEISSNSIISENLSDEYSAMIDFENDENEEELVARILNVDNNGDSLSIVFGEKIKFIDLYHPHETILNLIDEKDNTFKLEAQNNVITLPIDLIKDKDSLKIKVIYKSENFTKETFLKNNKRKSFNYGDFGVDLNMATNNVLIIDILKKTNIGIKINSVDFDGDYFEFKGKSSAKVNNFFIKNIVSLETIDYSIDYSGVDFTLKIPYEDIFNSPVKKWELNCRDSLNSIVSAFDFIYYKDYNKIKIFNCRNKIVIENSIINPFEELGIIFSKVQDLNSKNNKLKKENRKYINQSRRLIESNQNLNNTIDEFKSRKDVRIVDKIKSIK